jgi:hypothetical protein
MPLQINIKYSSYQNYLSIQKSLNTMGLSIRFVSSIKSLSQFFKKRTYKQNQLAAQQATKSDAQLKVKTHKAHTLRWGLGLSDLPVFVLSA